MHSCHTAQPLCPPDGLVLQGVGVRSINGQQDGAHRDILAPGDRHGVGEEDRALVGVQHCDVHRGRGAGPVGNAGHQWVLVLHLDEQSVEGGNLIVQWLGGQREEGSVASQSRGHPIWCAPEKRQGDSGRQNRKGQIEAVGLPSGLSLPPENGGEWGPETLRFCGFWSS